MGAERLPHTQQVVSISFTLAELWLLNDFIRHELPAGGTWQFPPASVDLNDEIAFAIETCEAHNVSEYTLQLSRGDLLAIDYFVRRDHKTPEGASGKQVLLKTFAARKALDFGLGIPDHAGDDLTYREVRH